MATSPVRLAFLDAAGNWLLSESARAECARNRAGDGRRRVHACFAFSGEQHFYGLGQGGRQLDRLGVTRQLWNTHIGHGPGSDMAVPLLVSNRGYALFFDNSSDARLAVGRSDNGVRITYTAEAGRLGWYFLIGRDLRGVMREVAELLGRPPLPPRWALGFLQSTRHFHDTAELRQLPRTIREKRIPCDGLIYLSTYGEANGWNRGVGHLEFQPTSCRTRPHLNDEAGPALRDHDPRVPGAPRGLAALRRGGGAGLPSGRGVRARSASGRRTPSTARASATSTSRARTSAAGGGPRTASWRELGIAGWWLDGGEGPPATAQLHAGDGTLLHNIYDRFRHEAFAEGEAADRPDQRVFLLCRSGAAGMQRFGATCWSGDINNDFPTLEAQIPLGLNTGLSGVPYWGTDVGGFFHPIAETGELYARWFQLGAFSPIFRSHGWVWRDHVPWAHGDEVEAICRATPSSATGSCPTRTRWPGRRTRSGLPLMRPLVLNYPDDPRVWTLGHEFLWGDDLLVAPVTREGATAWPVYLPAGGWYDFWTRRPSRGAGRRHARRAARAPAAARARRRHHPDGADRPAHGRAPARRGHAADLSGGPSRFELYEDDGRSNAYRRGQHAVTRFECAAEPAGITVRIGDPVGARSVVPASRRYLLRLRIARPLAVTVDGQATLPRRAGPDRGGAGWWLDGRGIHHRPPPRPGPSLDRAPARVVGHDLKYQVSVCAM